MMVITNEIVFEVVRQYKTTKEDNYILWFVLKKFEKTYKNKNLSWSQHKEYMSIHNIKELKKTRIISCAENDFHLWFQHIDFTITRILHKQTFLPK